jgi:glycosyltransferase involved in cell wall biosynthesis
MNNILVNGISAKWGGGKSILVNFLSLLSNSNKNDQFIVVVPANAEYSAYARENIIILPVKGSALSLCRYYLFTIRRIIKKYQVSLVFNLADLIAPVSTRQLYLFDWPYAIYPESIVWKRMRLSEWLFKKVKLFLIRCCIRLPVLLIAQTKVSETRLKKRFSIDNIDVIPNAVSLDNFTGGVHKNFGLPPNTIKFLYLTKYYSHKNIEIFLSLAEIIRRENLPYTIVITIGEDQHPNVKRFLETIAKEKLDDIVINVGPVSMENVPSLYQQCDALLMPSLLESFSGTYVEAMYHGKPIFTSDMDFAKVVCGDAGYYFDPLKADSIIDSIVTAYRDPNLLSAKVAVGKERLKTFLSWQEAFDKFITVIKKYQ